MTGPGTEYAELLARAAPFLQRRPPAEGGAGFGRVAVAGDEWLRAAAEPYLRAGLPDLPLSPDELVDALIVALAELDLDLGGAGLRAWDKGKHPRDPLTGRFRSTVDVLKERIHKHRRDGVGDPFDGYDREQLRKVARARGIDLKRGEGRDSIARKLLDHLGAGAPDRPGRRQNGIIRGKDRIEGLSRHYRDSPADYQGRRRASFDTPYDMEMALIAEAQDFDGPPLVATRGEVDAAVAAGWVETWRGVGGGMYGGGGTDKTPAQINADLRFGPWEPGRGLYGNGMYASARRGTGETFRGRDPKTNHPSGPGPDFGPEDYQGDAEPDSLLRIAVDPKARLGDFDTLREEMRGWLADRSDAPERTVFSDVGRYAAARGYDGLIVRNHGDGAFYPGFETDELDDEAVGNFPQADQYVIFNRTAIMIQRREDEP